jgi:hypothetical protein
MKLYGVILWQSLTELVAEDELFKRRNQFDYCKAWLMGL